MIRHGSFVVVRCCAASLCRGTEDYLLLKKNNKNTPMIITTRTIATPSKPLFMAAAKKKKGGPRSSKNKKIRSNKEKPKLAELVIEPRAKEEMSSPIMIDVDAEAVKEWNESGRFNHNPYPVDIVRVDKGPPPSLSEDEFVEGLKSLHEERLELIRSNLSPKEIEKLAADVVLMLFGEASFSETVHSLKYFLETNRDITPENHSALEAAIQDAQDSKDKIELIEAIERRLPKGEAAYIVQLVHQMDSEIAYQEPAERIERIELGALPLEVKEMYLTRKRKLMFGRKFGTSCTGRGVSMGSTMRTESTRYSGVPITEETCGTIGKTSIVGLVLSWMDHFLLFLGKRVVGVEGDLMKNCRGKLVRVPPGCVWVEGDNRRQSMDSRVFGPVPRTNLRFLYNDPPLEHILETEPTSDYKDR